MLKLTQGFSWIRSQFPIGSWIGAGGVGGLVMGWVFGFSAIFCLIGDTLTSTRIFLGISSKARPESDACTLVGT